MTERHTVDSITSDALDALYEQIAAAEAGEAQRQLATAREALASATTRAARAEAAVARVRAVAGWAIQGWSDLSPEKVLLAVEGHQPAPAPAATEATDGGDCCGAEPPSDGSWGDCWCTLQPGHDGEHRCQPCTDRHGAPGWTDPARPA